MSTRHSEAVTRKTKRLAREKTNGSVMRGVRGRVSVGGPGGSRSGARALSSAEMKAEQKSGRFGLDERGGRGSGVADGRDPDGCDQAEAGHHDNLRTFQRTERSTCRRGAHNIRLRDTSTSVFNVCLDIFISVNIPSIFVICGGVIEGQAQVNMASPISQESWSFCSAHHFFSSVSHFKHVSGDLRTPTDNYHSDQKKKKKPVSKRRGEESGVL
ncbi:hypothetical protein WMY93_028455 [Mugilogobius chulae]|uniref:Uncharacterized protein n=1 Tax=Mugilogobius chulae TaxID=88201 RepID=A0AAW0N045_9GOBI